MKINRGVNNHPSIKKLQKKIRHEDIPYIWMFGCFIFGEKKWDIVIFEVCKVSKITHDDKYRRKHYECAKQINLRKSVLIGDFSGKKWRQNPCNGTDDKE